MGRLRQIGKTLTKYEEEETPQAQAVVALCHALDTCISNPPCDKKLEQLDEALAQVRAFYPRGRRTDLAVLLGLAKQKVEKLDKILNPLPKGYYGVMHPV